MRKSKKKIGNYLIDFDKPIGKGTYGKVFICNCVTTNEEYAIKIIDKSYLGTSEYMKEALKKELAIHQKLHSENIVRFVEAIQTNNNYYLVQEYCREGNLRELMVRHGKIQEGDALHCLKGMCQAFEELLQKGVLHRDLKPQNVLIHEGIIKIADFGFAKQLFSRRQLSSTMIGTPLYMAPQILRHEKYTSKCDIWSVGVIYYELLYGRPPWQGESVTQLLGRIQSIPLMFPPEPIVSEMSKQFLASALHLQQNPRPSWIQLFEQELLGNVFYNKAQEWRERYLHVAKSLDRLSAKVTVEQLIGGFLQLRVSALNFDNFQLIMRWLLPHTDDNDMGIMYELFDKDQNGVIDFEEFLGSFSICEESTIDILHRLIVQGHFHEQLSDWQIFSKLCEREGIQSQKQMEKVHRIVSSITLQA